MSAPEAINNNVIDYAEMVMAWTDHLQLQQETTHITKSNNHEMQFQNAHLLISKNNVQGYSRYWLLDSMHLNNK